MRFAGAFRAGSSRGTVEQEFQQMQSFMWYARRLRAMSPAELAFRLGRASAIQVQRFRFPRLSVPDPREAAARFEPIPVPEVDNAAYLKKADRVASGELDILALTNHVFGVRPRWNVDPMTGTSAPLTFGKLLNYRSETSVGNIKYLWEPARHRQFVCLAQAYRLSGDAAYLANLVDQVMSWIDQCPFGRGPHWCSSLEAAIRLINWARIWRIVGGLNYWLEAGVERRSLSMWLVSIYQHMHFIDSYYSQFSSANNHLIGEAAGVYIGSSTWPVWDECQAWTSRSRSILINEASEQVHVDGVGKEQTTAYQQFVLDFLIAAGLESERSDDVFPVAYRETIHRMLAFIASVMDCRGNVPMIGDSDDGYVFDLAAEPDFCNFQSLLATGSRLFNDEYFSMKANRLDSKTAWLLAGHDETIWKLPSSKTNEAFNRPPNAFPEGGYYILASEPDRPEIKLVVDAGPLGYGRLAAHGHADALSFTLSASGLPIIVDPGTYVYGGDPKWRRYFRGTAAHNTVRIDEVDQSAIGGDFIWRSQANATASNFEDAKSVGRIEASHDGYLRLPDPVSHTRVIELRKRDRKIRIEDSIQCAAMHFVEIFFQLTDVAVAAQSGSSVKVLCGNIAMTIRGDGYLDCELHLGDIERPAGWISYRFGEKIPSTTVRFFGEITASRTFVTELALS